MAEKIAYIDPEQCDNSPMCPLPDVCKQGAQENKYVPEGETCSES